MSIEQKILINLVHCIIGNNWLKEHSQEDYRAYTIATVKAAFNAGFDSGALEDFHTDDCGAVYHGLTLASWDEFMAENDAQLEAELAMNRAIVGGAR